MTFGQKLRELREAKGLSRAALAETCGVPFGTIHGYEAGRRSPALATTLKLARALGVDCTAFADCDDMKEVEPEKPAKPSKKRK